MKLFFLFLSSLISLFSSSVLSRQGEPGETFAVHPNAYLKADRIDAAHAVSAGAQQTIFYQDFESDLPEWAMGDFRETNGLMWHADTFNAYSGSSWWCGNSAYGGYLNSHYQVMTTPDIDLSGTMAPDLSFMHYYATEYDSTLTPEENRWDGCHVRISIDGGQTYHLLNPVGGYDPPDSLWAWDWHHEIVPGGYGGWHGFSAGWKPARFDLSPYAGQSVRLRFIFASDAAVDVQNDARLWGWFVDDITIKDGQNILFFDDAGDSPNLTPFILSEGSGCYPHHSGITEIDYHSPTHCWHCDNDTSITNRLITPWISLPAGDHRLFLSYWIHTDMPDSNGDNDDYLDDFYAVEYSQDELIWHRLTYDYARKNLGSDIGWVEMRPGLNWNGTLNLQAFVGEKIKLRWIVFNDNNHDGGRGSGLFLDDIEITQAPLRPWTVDDDGPADFNSIQEAIQNAFSGDTIIVKDGLYQENITINKPLTIRSENGASQTIIEALNSKNHAVEIITPSVVLSGFTIKNATEHSRAGVYMSRASNCFISENSICNNFYGLYVYTGCKNTVVAFNDIIDNKRGMALYPNDNIVYMNNFDNDVNVASGTSYKWFSPSKQEYFYRNEAYISALGNYWSDYQGVDSDGNGIGDSKYSEANDNYPLISPYDHYTLYTLTYHPAVEIKVGDKVTFQADITSPTGGKNIIYSWQLGDGAVKTGKIINHAYTAGDFYTVRCRVFVDSDTFRLKPIHILVLPFAVKKISEDETGTLYRLGRGDHLDMDNGTVVWSCYDGNDLEILFYDGNAVRLLTDNKDEDIAAQNAHGYLTYQHGINLYLETEYHFYLFHSLRSHWIKDNSTSADIILYDGATNRTFSDSIAFNYWEQVYLAPTQYSDVLYTYDSGGSEVSRTVWTYHYIHFLQDQLSADHLDHGRVVWIGKEAVDDLGRIMYYDGQSVSYLTDGQMEVQHPRFYHDGILWRGHDGNDWEIFLYDAGTTTPLTNNDQDDSFAGGDGNGWYSGSDSTELYLLKGKEVIQLAAHPAGMFDFFIKNDGAVWCARDQTDSDIFLYDGQSILPLSTNDLPDISPSISDGQVVWTGYDGVDYEIFYYDGSNTLQLTDNSHDDVKPQIACGRIAWEAFDGDDTEIFYYDGTNIHQLTDNDIEDDLIQFDGTSILWQDDQTDIYLFSLTSICSLPQSDESLVPLAYRLENNFPNPFNSETLIKYVLPHPAFVRISIFNSIGEKIRTLVHARKMVGHHQIAWDGRNDSGCPVSSAVYFYKMQANSYTKMHKMLLLR
ncbi:right-handed parallel beta-helix repeat-containing protein [candidate division KSB1 bacterium]|nr:right-handed parallel beta-helix repeat-containing protein [candidate division KSB1 bacterium]